MVGRGVRYSIMARRDQRLTIQMRDVWQGFVTSGRELGTNVTARKTFLYTVIAAAVISANFNLLTILSHLHFHPEEGLLRPLLQEASSWIGMILFVWVPWTGYRLAPVEQPRWRLLLHIPFALAYGLGHVGSFVLLRKAAYLAQGSSYSFGPLWQNAGYELGKDALAYSLFIVGFVFVNYIQRQSRPPALLQPPLQQPATFDIRDGTKLSRVPVEDILAVSSGGNYAEFVLRDGRRLCMRATLSALESELTPLGFVRTHRSWLLNVRQVTGLDPAGSGNYAVRLGELTVPLSRRFPEALARLRGE
jgi:hypothetical protein